MDRTDRYNSGGEGLKLIAGGDKTGISVSGAEQRSILCCFFHQNRAIETMDTHIRTHTHMHLQ